MPQHGKRGFTLIELLIVVLIIAILAAIAVPNFLEFQTRAKVSSVYSDFRTMKTAMEAYYVDNNTYITLAGGWARGESDVWAMLTTPIAYISTILYSPFKSQTAQEENLIGSGEQEVYRYFSQSLNQFGEAGKSVGLEWIIQCAGPDTVNTFNGFGPDAVRMDQNEGSMWLLYNPTNGTVSAGDLLASNKRIYQ